MGGVFSSHECRAGCGGARCCSCATPVPGCPAPAAGCPFDQGCHFPAPPCPPPEPACLPGLGFLSTCPQQPSFSSNLFGGSQCSSSHLFPGTGSQGFPCPQNSFGRSSNCQCPPNSFGRSSNCQCPPNSFGRSSNCQCPPKVNSMPMFGPNLLKQMFSSKSFQFPMGPGQMCGGQSMRQMCPGQQQSCGGSPSGQMFPGKMCCGQSGMNLPAAGMQQMCPARSSIRFECPPQPACPPPCPAPCPATKQQSYEPPQMKPQRCCDPKLCAQYEQMYGGIDSLSSEESIPVSCEEEQKEKCCGSKRKLYRDNRCGSSTIIGSMQEVRSERQRRMVCRDPSHHGGCGKSRRPAVRPPPQPGCPAGPCCSSSREVRPRRPGPTCSRPSSQPSSCCGSQTNLHRGSGAAPCQRSKKSRSRVTVQEPKTKRTPRPSPRASTRSIPQYEEEYSEESQEAPPVCPAPCLKRRPQPKPRPRPPPPPPPPEYRDYNTNNEGPDLYKNSKSKASDFLRIFLVLGGECCKILLQLVFLLRQYLGKMCNEVMTRKKCYTQRCCGS